MSGPVKTKLEIVQDRITQYDIRFPVATLAKEMKLNKGYVSGVLNGQKPISDNFWETFNKKYPEKNGTPQKHTDLTGAHVTLQDHIDLLKDYNEKLFALLNSNLGSLQEGQRIMIAYQKAWVDHAAEKESGGDPDKKEEIRYKMNKSVDDILHLGSLSGTQTGSGKRGKG